ncbi:glycoside hydrolase family 17 protein [Thalassotalea eurytherma]|uniref:Endo-1,3-beta-glucanase btgC n=1 Tax=Thalassotalea eurytherma TaxID=1144278 RepID=A0ABQ6H2H1_9GAMM|nr:glycosyl hydrolase family 17 protein [Thalassotalea eurytherma]GLX81076.1 hypothetical protein theurythT_05280 [Thalassotalea eurytherma]
MSNRKKKYMSISGMNVINLPEDELKAKARTILDEKIHGISFSPYGEGQKPGDKVTMMQINERLSVIANNIHWIRSFSCTKGNELIPEAAKAKGLKTLVGAWLNDDLENNEKEITNLISLAKAGFVDVAAVGNEVLLREELSEDQLIEYLVRVKAALPDIPVGYVDAYYEFEDHPRITEQCDVILANCYPFWEGCALEYSILYMKDMFRRATKIANGKKVIITETGWPDQGPSEWGADPSFVNAMKYFIGTYQWAGEEDIDVFYFSSFDEKWKVKDEGGVGAHWGLWDTHGNYKY